MEVEQGGVASLRWILSKSAQGLDRGEFLLVGGSVFAFPNFHVEILRGSMQP